MARVALTEYAAKKLFLGDSYTGVSVTPETVDEVTATLDPEVSFIVKIDVGIKKRGKQGLIRLNIPAKDVPKAAKELFALGHERCVVEEMVPHEESQEKYISIDVLRDGAQVLYSEKGGVSIEDDPDSVQNVLIPRVQMLQAQPELEIDGVPLSSLLETMRKYHFSFCEINPYILKNGAFFPLDMAVEIDSSKEGRLPQWAQEHVLHKKVASEQEAEVLRQDARTQAALNLHTLNADGSILTLFSGGGASLVALDSLVTAGLQDKVINYSEYSGAPTRDETHAYVSTLLEVLFASKSKEKVVLIAGGVANFTDVMATFQGIVDAFKENIKELKKHNVYVCVRRGGPNQDAGLSHLRDYLNEESVPNDVHDPSFSLGAVGSLVISHV
jgi:ATP citrate (pro-S)-lyase